MVAPALMAQLADLPLEDKREVVTTLQEAIDEEARVEAFIGSVLARPEVQEGIKHVREGVNLVELPR